MSLCAAAAQTATDWISGAAKALDRCTPKRDIIYRRAPETGGAVKCLTVPEVIRHARTPASAQQ